MSAVLPLQISCSCFWLSFLLKRGSAASQAPCTEYQGSVNQDGKDLPLVDEESIEVGGLLDVEDLEEDKVVEVEVDAVVQLPGGEVL